MEDISIVGYTDVLIEVNKIFAFADMRKVKRYLGEWLYGFNSSESDKGRMYAYSWICG